MEHRLNLPRLNTLHRLLLIIAVGTSIRLALSYLTYGNYDMDTWRIVAGIASAGGNFYAETDRYPYSPLWAMTLGVIERAGHGVPGLPFYFLVKAFLTMIDLVSLVFIILIAKNQDISPVIPAAAYYLNPISFLLTGVHGQFENLALLPVLGGIYFFLKSGGSTSGKMVLWLGSSLGMWIKHSLFFLPVICVRASIKRPWLILAMLFVTLAGFALLFFPYWHGASESIKNHLFHYSTPPRRYGISFFVPAWATMRAVFVMAACAFSLLLSRRTDLVRQCLLGVLFFIVFTPIIGIQYFVLPIAFGALRPSKWFFIYTGVGTLFILGSPVNLHVAWCSIVRGNYLWAAAVLWFIAELFQRNQDEKIRIS